MEVVVVPSEGLSTCFERGLVGYVLDEIEDEVLDDGPVGGARVGSQAHEVVVEDDVEDLEHVPKKGKPLFR